MVWCCRVFVDMLLYGGVAWRGRTCAVGEGGASSQPAFIAFPSCLPSHLTSLYFTSSRPLDGSSHDLLAILFRNVSVSAPGDSDRLLSCQQTGRQAPMCCILIEMGSTTAKTWPYLHFQTHHASILDATEPSFEACRPWNVEFHASSRTTSRGMLATTSRHASASNS